MVTKLTQSNNSKFSHASVVRTSTHYINIYANDAISLITSIMDTTEKGSNKKNIFMGQDKPESYLGKQLVEWNWWEDENMYATKCLFVCFLPCVHERERNKCSSKNVNVFRRKKRRKERSSKWWDDTYKGKRSNELEKRFHFILFFEKESHFIYVPFPSWTILLGNNGAHAAQLTVKLKEGRRKYRWSKMEKEFIWLKNSGVSK